eukprot:3758546-Prymnesium_polylepis.1
MGWYNNAFQLLKEISLATGEGSAADGEGSAADGESNAADGEGRAVQDAPGAERVPAWLRGMMAP